jgi:hypothetical protein
MDIEEQSFDFARDIIKQVIALSSSFPKKKAQLVELSSI